MEKMEDKIQRINRILLDLYDNSYSDREFNYRVVYNYLKTYKLSYNAKSFKVSDRCFNNWIERFGSKDNIDCFCSFSNKYFCQFVNGEVNYEAIKMYVPLDEKHIFEGAKLIFDFLASNNISHRSKIASDIRVDDIVIRLWNVEDAKKLQSFLDNNAYIQEGLLSTHPFAFSCNGINYAYDGDTSYNMCLSVIISSYISNMKSQNADRSMINFDTFNSFLSNFVNNYSDVKVLSELRSLGSSSFSYAFLVTNLIKKAINFSNVDDFYAFFEYVYKLDKEKMGWDLTLYSNRVSESDKLYLINNEELKDINQGYNEEDKVSLFNEVIITTMKKYYLGHSESDPEHSGLDNIYQFLRGYRDCVTRDNNLRNRVSVTFKTVDELYDIINSSGIVGDDIYTKATNYIYMIMLNEIIRCMEIRFPGNFYENLERFMEEDNLSLITNSVGNARRLACTLNGMTMRKFLDDLGVKDIYEYIDNYYVKNDKRIGGR